MLGKDFLPPVLLDQFEFIVCVVAVIKYCCTSDVKVAEARCKRFVVRHCNPSYVIKRLGASMRERVEARLRWWDKGQGLPR